MAQTTVSKAWRQEVKQRIDLRELLADQLDEFKPGNPATARCPFHAERTPSFKVYPDHYFCFGCEEHGDLFNWLERQEGLSQREALEKVAELAGLPLPAGDDSNGQGETKGSKRVDLAALVGRAYVALAESDDPIAQKARAYLKDRGLADVAAELKLGAVTPEIVRTLPERERKRLSGRLIVPYLLEGSVVSLTARALLGQEPKYQRPEGAIPCPYNADALTNARREKWALLLEGELDCVSARVALGSDAPVLGLPGGKLPVGWAKRLAGITCYVLMDPDEAGQRHENKLVEELSAEGAKVRRIRWQQGDVNEFLVAHGPEALAQELADRMEEAEAPTDLSYIRTGFLAEMSQRAARPHPAYSTTIPSLDAVLGRGLGEGLHVLGGITAGGKTALSLQIACHNAAAGLPVLYVSYEQSKFELWARNLARMTGVPVAACKTGRYLSRQGEVSTAEYLRMNHARELAQLEAIARHLRVVEGDAGAILDGGARWSVGVIRAEAEALAEAYDMPPLVVVDYLQRMPVPEQHARRELRERVGLIASALQVELARGLGCPVLVLSSVNRAAYKRGEDSPEALLASFKEAGEVEFTAYTGILLYRLTESEAAEKNLLPSRFTGGKDWNPLALHVVKNREGETGRVLARFYGREGRFEDAGRDDHAKGK